MPPGSSARTAAAPARHLHRRTLPRARFGEEQRAVLEFERREHQLRRDPRPLLRRGGRPPAQAAGDHQVQHEITILPAPRSRRLRAGGVGKREHDAFPDAVDRGDDGAGDRLERRIDRAQDERAQQEHPIEPPADDVPLQRLEVDDEIGKLGQDWNLIVRIGLTRARRSVLTVDELNGHCRRQNLMRLIALLLTAMLIGPAAAAQTAHIVLAPFPCVLGRGREGRRGPRFSGFTREDSRRAGARISRSGLPAQERAGHAPVPHRDSRASENRRIAGDAGFQGRTDPAGRRLRLRAAAGHVPRRRQSAGPAVRGVQPDASWPSSRPSRRSARCSPNTWRRV